MKASLVGPRLDFPYDLLDFRDLDGDRLLESEWIGDNVIAILGKVRDERQAVRQILEKITGLSPGEGNTALKQFLILSGLRRMTQTIAEEARKMPITESILDDEVFGPVFQRGLVEGRQAGIEEGGRKEALNVLRRLVERRFGPIPEPAASRLASRTASELEELCVRVLTAQSIDELLD